MREIRLLVVEDDYEYQKRLIRMYRDLFRKAKPALRSGVNQTDDGQEAIDWLNENQYDLISLDINLSTPYLTNGKMTKKYKGADGRDLIAVAKESGCRGLIVITGFAHDITVPSTLLAFDEAGSPRSQEEASRETRGQRIRLEDEIKKLWGPQYKLFHKDEQKDVDFTIDEISKLLTAEELIKLCKPKNRFVRSSNPDVWNIVFDGTPFPIRDYSGMHYIAQLLREPAREFPVFDLEPTDPTDLSISAENFKAGEKSSAASAAETISHKFQVERLVEDHDPESKANLRNLIKKNEERAEAIREELEEIGAVMSGTGGGYSPKVYEQLLRELEKIADETNWARAILKRAGKRKSSMPPLVKNSYDRIRKGILDSLGKIEEAEKATIRARKKTKLLTVSRHLKEFIIIRDGLFTYKPEPPVEWEITEPAIRLQGIDR